LKYRVGDDTRNLQSCRHMTGFKMDASFRFSSEDVVKPVCEISPLRTFERRCLTPRCSRNLPQAKYRQLSWLLETGASEISSIFAFCRVHSLKSRPMRSEFRVLLFFYPLMTLDITRRHATNLEDGKEMYHRRKRSGLARARRLSCRCP